MNKKKIISLVMYIVMMIILILVLDFGTYQFNAGDICVYAKELQINENLASEASVSISDNMAGAIMNLWQLNDENMTTEITRNTGSDVKNSYVGDDYFQFDWNDAVSVNKIVLSSWYCYGQAPTSWKITVFQEDTQHWQEIALLENVDWGEGTGLQSKSMIFTKQNNVKSLRVHIMDNNNDWLKYVIKEIGIYNDESAIYGDANSDSIVDICDFVRTKKYVAGNGKEVNQTAIDLDRNEIVDASDATALGDFLIGKESMVPSKNGYILDWSDEFDGTNLDKNKWLTKYFPHATSNEAWAQAKYEVKDGKLSLILDESTKSFAYGNDDGMKVSSIQTYEKDNLHPVAPQAPGKLVDTFNGYSTKYGYFELKCRAPSCGGGGAIAWWLTGIEDDERIEIDADGIEKRVTNHCGEIDIIENIIDRPNFQRFNVIPHADSSLYSTNWYQTVEGDFVNEWHIYALDWTPESMDFYIDGVKRKSVEASPQYEMCVYLSMYMVTNPESVPNYTWGYDNGIYPKKWDIDYMRVYKKK